MNDYCASLGLALRALNRVDKTAKKLEDLAAHVNYLRRKHNFLVFYTAGVVIFGGMWVRKLQDRVDTLQKHVQYLESPQEKDESKGE